MFVRATEDFDCGTHKCTKGRVFDVPEYIAKKFLESGQFAEVEAEQAIREFHGGEEAAVELPVKRKRGRPRGRPALSKSAPGGQTPPTPRDPNTDSA